MISLQDLMENTKEKKETAKSKKLKQKRKRITKEERTINKNYNLRYIVKVNFTRMEEFKFIEVFDKLEQKNVLTANVPNSKVYNRFNNLISYYGKKNTIIEDNIDIETFKRSN